MKRSMFLRGSLAAIFTLAVAAVAPAAAQNAGDPPGLDRAIAAQEFHTDRLVLTDGVVGTGVWVNARGQAAIVVMTEDLWVTGLPRSLDGVPVVVRVTGAFRAINKPDTNGNHDHGTDTEDNTTTAIDPTSKFDRPVPIGVSTGNATSCSAGTIGARVTDGVDVYALSNNHVYALENGGQIDVNADGINQPGLYDRYDGTNCVPVAGDPIGTLHDFVEIEFSTIAFNTVDAAIALSSTIDLGNSTPSDGYGTPSSTTADHIACLNKRVLKYGRTTSLTKGSAFVINATIYVGYTSGTARFVNQIVVDGGKVGFILAGESGSLLVLQKGNATCGLLFAGSEFGRFGIANRIDDVLSAFGVEIDGN